MTKRMACIIFLFCAATISVSAQLTTLVSFDANGQDASFAQFVLGNNGNFYGTTLTGGVSDEGTVFEMSPAGKLATLYSFCAQTACSDGAHPYAGLIQATNGNLYGTTYLGGTNNSGTVFEITPAGKLTTLYRFCSLPGCPDGANPTAGLLQAADGNLYGTTCCGGAYSDGTVYKITTAGVLTTLASFDGVNGHDPAYASLIQGADGNFYGTTLLGGVYAGCGDSRGCGTIFRITPRGELTSLYSFCAELNCTDGAAPFGALMQATNGNFYGTAIVGGYYGYGTVFEIGAAGKLRTLYNFFATDGVNPTAALIQGTDGNLYGTTAAGGANKNTGTIFAITPSGILTTLYSFCSQASCADGSNPFESLIQATNGEFYGLTFAGGTSSNCTGGCGTAFSLSMGLGPFIETRLSSGKAESRVTVLGNNLTGTTAVNFNGTPSAFTVVSKTEILTTVPSGASTGFVTAATPSGTLKSNKPFRIIP